MQRADMDFKGPAPAATAKEVSPRPNGLSILEYEREPYRRWFDLTSQQGPSISSEAAFASLKPLPVARYEVDLPEPDEELGYFIAVTVMVGQRDEPLDAVWVEDLQFRLNLGLVEPLFLPEEV